MFCVNLRPMHIGGVRGEVRILGADSAAGVVLLRPSMPVDDGDKPVFRVRRVDVTADAGDQSEWADIRIPQLHLGATVKRPDYAIEETGAAEHELVAVAEALGIVVLLVEEPCVQV